MRKRNIIINPVLDEMEDYFRPLTERKRARRIRDKQRMKARARWVAKVIWAYRPEEAHMADRYADNLKPCSCWMCGNQRRHHGPRPQEMRGLAAASAREDIYDDRDA